MSSKLFALFHIFMCFWTDYIVKKQVLFCFYNQFKGRCQIFVNKGLLAGVD